MDSSENQKTILIAAEYERQLKANALDIGEATAAAD